MATTEIFSQVIQNQSETDSIFVRLTTESDISVRHIQLQRMEIAEMFSSGSPIISLEFVDGNGDFVNHIKPNPSTKYMLDIGRSVTETLRIELRCSKIVMVNQKPGSSESIAFKMFFVHHGWNELVNKRRSRGWKDKKFSEIVEELAKESEFSKVTVSDTEMIAPFYIQPYWNNMQTIRNLRNKSRTRNGGHMEFGATTAGEFFFKSIGDMIEEQKAAAMAKKLTTFRMEGQRTVIPSQISSYSDNNKNPTYFAHFTGEESYMDAIINGAGGATSMFVDSETGQYNKSSVVYSNMETPQLADWAAVQKEHEVTGMRMYGGRDGDIGAEAQNRVTDVVDSSSRFEIVSEGAPFIHIGEMVELIIPVPPSINSTIPQNIIYSGFYIVCGVKHTINFSKSVMNSTLSLMREGFDGKDLTGYITSKTGKFVGSK